MTTKGIETSKRIGRRFAVESALAGIAAPAAFLPLTGATHVASVAVPVAAAGVHGLIRHHRRTGDSPYEIDSMSLGFHLSRGQTNCHVVRRSRIRVNGPADNFPGGRIRWSAGHADLTANARPLNDDCTPTFIEEENGIFQIRYMLNRYVRRGTSMEVGFTTTMRETDPVLDPFITLDCNAYDLATHSRVTMSITSDEPLLDTRSTIVGAEHQSMASYKQGLPPVRTTDDRSLVRTPCDIGWQWTFKPSRSGFFRLGFL